MATEAQKRAMRRYYMKTKAGKRTVALRFDRTSDADILEKLDSVPSKLEYVRKVVRGDLNG